uniref:Putative Erf family protein n=1 Tax=viral metagenome TaxID=1070528 RepID=A0A6M3L7K1_9ZZZZ
MSKDKEIIEVKAEATPSDMIRMAIDKGADLEKLEKLLALKERWEANEARKVFTASFAMVQKEILAVIKTKVNPQTHSKYAPLEGIIEGAKPIYTKEGFSVIFYEGKPDVPEAVRVCADVLHKFGHKETYYYDVPLDGLGIKGNANMTKIHGKSSSVSYGRRYLMCMIWNIATEDDDGNAASVEYIDEAQKSSITDWITEKKVDTKKLCAFFSIESIEKLPKTKFQQAITMLKAHQPKATVKK